MKYALHASLHRPARRPDQTVARSGSERETAPDHRIPSAGDVESVASPFRPRPAFLPPQPTVIVNAYGKPAVVSSLPPAIVTDHERPTLKFPAVPPPVTPPHPNSPEPLLDINEPTLEEKPVRLANISGEIDVDDDERDDEHGDDIGDDINDDGDRDQATDEGVDADDEEADRGPKTRIAHVSHLGNHSNLRPRKKGTSGPARQVERETSDGVPHIEPIDPAAWLADEAHARTSDRRDSADGVDNSDTVVPPLRTRPNIV